jgi:hypothetical protein
MINSSLQWAGTACLLTMYVLMSFFPEVYPWNLVAGLTGGSMFFAWSLRVKNTQQVIVNLAGITVCCLGLLKYFL